MKYLKRITDCPIYVFPDDSTIEKNGVTVSGKFKCISKTSWCCKDSNDTIYSPVDGVVTIPSGITWVAMGNNPGCHPCVLIDASAPDLSYFPSYENMIIEDAKVLNDEESKALFTDDYLDSDIISYIKKNGTTANYPIKIKPINSEIYWIIYYISTDHDYLFSTGENIDDFTLGKNMKFIIRTNCENASDIKVYNKRHIANDTYVALYNNDTDLLYHNGYAVLDYRPSSRNIKIAKSAKLKDSDGNVLNKFCVNGIPYFVECPDNCIIYDNSKAYDATHPISISRPA